MTTPFRRSKHPSCSFPERGTLYIAPANECTGHKLRRFLRRARFAFAEPHPDILAILVSPGQLQQLSRDFSALLSHREVRDSTSLWVEAGESVSLPQLMRAQPLGNLIDRVKGEWLVEMVREERLVAHFQPIVYSFAPEIIFAYECLLRGRDRDGTLVPPTEIFQAARSANLFLQLDGAARHTAIRAALENHLTTNLFINFAPASLEDPIQCLNSTMGVIERAGVPPERVVFEITESEEVLDVRGLFEVFAFYREIGFRIALDDLGTGYNSMHLLPKLRPEFVKLDSVLISGVDTDLYKARIAAKLLELAQDLKISTIAEGVETEGEWVWLRDHGVDYVQGFLFGVPDCPPPIPRVHPERQFTTY